MIETLEDLEAFSNYGQIANGPSAEHLKEQVKELYEAGAIRVESDLEEEAEIYIHVPKMISADFAVLLAHLRADEIDIQEEDESKTVIRVWWD